MRGILLKSLLPLLLALPLLAQDNAPPPLSLQDCLAIALEQQADIQLGEYALTGAQQRERQARSGYYPQVSVANAELLVRSGAVGAGSDGTSLTVSQNFYDGGLRETRLRGARADVLQNTYTLDRTRQTVIFRVTQAYYTVLRSLRLSEVQQTRIQALEGQRALVQARVEVGDAARVDLLPVEAELANARVDLLFAQNAVRTAAIALQSAMGIEAQAAFTVQDVTAPEPVELPVLDEQLALALASRPEVAQLDAGIDAAQASVQTARIALYPRLVVSGGYTQPVGSNDPHGLSVSGAITYDLFDGGSNRAAYREAQAGLSGAELRAAQVRRDIRADVQNAYLNLESARERLTAAGLAQEVAETNARVQEERYRQGLGIPLDLLNAQVDLATARSNAVQAHYDYYIAQAQLDYATGTPGGEE